MTKLIAEAQKFNPDSIVTLFNLDLTALGGGMNFFTPVSLRATSFSRTPVQWRGNNYLPIPCEASGFEITTSSQFPRPKLQVANVMNTFAEELQTYDNLAGAEITRFRVFRKHLDDGEDADPDIMFPPDVYRIDRKSNDDPLMLEFELATVIDQEGVQLPRRQVIRNTCTHVYRIWNPNTETFDYSKATCPYTGTDMFDEAGNPVTDGALDKPSKLIKTCCKPRFKNAPLPTRAFPGVGKSR